MSEAKGARGSRWTPRWWQSMQSGRGCQGYSDPSIPLPVPHLTRSTTSTKSASCSPPAPRTRSSKPCLATVTSSMMVIRECMRLLMVCVALK